MAADNSNGKMKKYEEVYAEDASSMLLSHTLIEREMQNESEHRYYCLQCKSEYLSIEDFLIFHESSGDAFIKEENVEDCTEVSQWEAIDDIIEYVGPSEEEDTLERQNEIEQTTFDSNIFLESNEKTDTDVLEDNLIFTGSTEDEQVVKTEVDESDNKYCCYDCRTVFQDLQIAEQHDCPGIGNTLEESDARENFLYNGSNDNDVSNELIEYMCAYCEKKFVDLLELEQHQIQCGSSNNEASTLKEVQTKFVEKYDAEDITETTQNLEATEQNQSSFGSYACTICNTNFTKFRSLKLHLRIHKERPMRRIQEALPAVAAQKYNKLDHFFCEICNKSFDQNLLAVHKNMHQNVEEYICQTCNRQFKNKESFEMHQQLHSSDKTNKSIINTGPTKAALRNARKGVKSMHVANAKATFPCQYCGHLFWRPHEKVRHEYVHTGEKPYPCEVCGKRFRVPYSLTLHLRTHTDIRPYVCAHCSKRFKSHSVYTHHMRTHLNDRAYKCDICGKSFRTMVRLCGHKNIHTKPFNCTLCNRPFASLFTLKSHMKSHSKNKVLDNLKHTCSVCGAVYARTGALRTHMKEMHGVESTETHPSDFDDQNDTVDTNTYEDEHEADEAAMMLLAGSDFMQL